MTNCLETVTYAHLVLRCVLGSIASHYPRGSLRCVVLYVKPVPLRQGWEAGAPVIRCVSPLAFGCILGKLQALAYDILPLEEGAGKRCSECASWAEPQATALSNSKHWFTTSFLWRKVPESDARSVQLCDTVLS